MESEECKFIIWTEIILLPTTTGYPSSKIEIPQFPSFQTFDWGLLRSSAESSQIQLRAGSSLEPVSAAKYLRPFRSSKVNRACRRCGTDKAGRWKVLSIWREESFLLNTKRIFALSELEIWLIELSMKSASSFAPLPNSFITSPFQIQEENCFPFSAPNSRFLKREILIEILIIIQRQEQEVAYKPNPYLFLWYIQMANFDLEVIWPV